MGMVTPLEGARIAVVGSVQGFDLALVRRLRAAGANVALVAGGSWSPAPAREGPQETHLIPGDVNRTDETHRIALRITAALEGLDVLINAPSSLARDQLTDSGAEEIDARLAAELEGPCRLMRALADPLTATAREGRPAVVVNVIGDGEAPTHEDPVAGRALLRMTAAWDRELRVRGIRAHALVPRPMVAAGSDGVAEGVAPRAPWDPMRGARDIVDLIVRLVRPEAAGTGSRPPPAEAPAAP